MAREVTSAQTALGRAVHIMRVRREIPLQIALSRAAGLGKDAAGGIERGAVDPTYSTLRALADALRVGLVELIEVALEIEREIAPSADSENDDGRVGPRPSSEGHPDGEGEVTPQA